MKCLKNKKRSIIILIFICISLQSVFAQISTDTDSSSEIILVNSFYKRYLPNVSRDDCYLFEYSTSSDSLFVKIIPKREVFKNSREEERFIMITSFTYDKEQRLSIPSDIKSNFNVVVLSVIYSPDVVYNSHYYEYSFVKKGKENLFKLKYLNKNAKRHPCR